ncbi:hypothetical protein O3M35_005325 [Rhynocoris fuscipes]|uniref:Lysosome-associated membrane glycoprotein 5 n=1 Tax=Rhynocoris fuscipes TaxID=488301 RepID=A0AAW1DK32_9HEMI
MFMLKYSILLLHVVFIFGLETDGKPLENKPKLVEVPVIEPTKPSPSTTVAPPEKTTVISTTEAPTVTPPSNSTTQSTPKPTVAPTTTNPPVTTVLPSTTTTEAPKPKYWEVTGQDGIVCILAEMNIQLDLKPEKDVKDISIKVPKIAEANGTCGATEQTIVLSWENNSLSLNFKANKSLEHYYLDSVGVDIKKDNISVSFLKDNITMFETALNHTYACSYSDPLKAVKDNGTVQFSFSDIKLIAFKADNSTAFANIYACPSDAPDIVPIVVGCALTVLVVVVLIAYLVSRRRTQTRGYLSM